MAKDGYTIHTCLEELGNPQLPAPLKTDNTTADGNVKDTEGLTPVHWASKEGQDAVILILLENGADMNAKKNDGWMPLHVLSFQGYEAIISLLLEKGTNPTITDENAKTSLKIAQEKNKQNYVAVMEEFAQQQQQDKNDWRVKR
jgi:cytohesin